MDGEVMMFIELQLTAEVFGRIVRERIRALDICVDQQEADEYVEEKDGRTTRYVLDGIEVLDDTQILRQRRPTQVVWLDFPRNYTSFEVPFLQISQAVTVRLVDVAKLEANGPAPTPPGHQFTVRPVFNVSVSVENKTVGHAGPVTLEIALDHIDLGLLDGIVPAGDRKRFEDVVRRFKLPPTSIDLAALSDSFGAIGMSFAAYNAGITCDEGGRRIALRIETRRDADLTQDWFSTDPEPLVDEDTGRQWAVLLDARIMTTAIEKLVGDGMRNAPKFELTRGPAVSYQSGGLRFTIDLEGEADLPVVSLDVKVNVGATLTVPQPNTLRLNFAFDVDPQGVVGFVVSVALLWPIIGAIMVDEDTIDLPEYLAGILVGPIGVALTAIVYLAGGSYLDEVDPMGAHPVRKIDDEHYEMDLPVDATPRGIGARLELTTVSGAPSGPLLSGPVVFQRKPPQGRLERVDFAPFAWRLAGRCGSGFTNVCDAGISIATTGDGVRVCTARFLGEPHAAYTLSHDETSVVVDCAFPPDGSPLPPCQVRLVTNRGVRTITIPPPVPASPSELHDLEVERIGRIGQCKGWIQHTVEDIRWRVDPPDLLRDPQLRHWEVVVTGLQVDESVTLRVPEGRTLAEAVAGADGVVRLEVLLDPAEGIDHLQAVLDGEVGREGRELSVRQVLYVRRDSVPARGRLRELELQPSELGQALTVTADRETRSWEVGQRGRPTLLTLGRSATLAKGRAPQRVGSVVAALHGSVLARHDPTHGCVDVYEAVASHQL